LVASLAYDPRQNRGRLQRFKSVLLRLVRSVSQWPPSTTKNIDVIIIIKYNYNESQSSPSLPKLPNHPNYTTP